MPENEKLNAAPEDSIFLESRFWLCFAALFLVIVLFHAKTVPFSNEFLYLLRLEPNFLPHDWTFSSPANEHWLFNFIFSFPARIFSLEVIGWTGRIAVWILSLAALIKLGKGWDISYSAIGTAIFLWLASSQATVGDEWIFGGFEAKTVAYVCLLFALVGFCTRNVIAPAVLLGLSFSFHPAVGLWAILAVGLALLFERLPTADFVKIVVVTALFALFGVVPLIAEQNSAAANSFADWQFVVVYRVPWHLDLFQFSRSGVVLLIVMFVFNCVALRKSENFALRLLLKFQIALAVFFLLGGGLRWLDIYPLLRLMPMRLFPVFTPLFFFLTAFYIIPRLAAKQFKIIVAILVLVIAASLNPFGRAFSQVRETVATWQRAPDDFQQTALWLARNTPPDALVIQPPERRDSWYFARRASVVSFAYPTYNRLGEWRARIADLTGNRQISKGETAGEEIERAYQALSEQQIEQLKTKYAATHLVSRAVYSYPVIFETKTYKVYQLP